MALDGLKVRDTAGDQRFPSPEEIAKAINQARAAFLLPLLSLEAAERFANEVASQNDEERFEAAWGVVHEALTTTDDLWLQNVERHEITAEVTDGN